MTTHQSTTENPDAERAARCLTVLFGYSDFDPVPHLVDLLTDAMHWCNHNKEDFESVLTAAREMLAFDLARAGRNRP